jgi:hypothetical protein
MHLVGKLRRKISNNDIAEIRSLKRTAKDTALNQRLILFEAVSFAVSFN